MFRVIIAAILRMRSPLFVDRLRALIRWVNSMPWKRDTPLTITPPSGNYTASELDTYAMSRWHRTPTLWPHSGAVKVVAPST